MSGEGMIQGMINTMSHTPKKYIHVSSSNVYGNFQNNAHETSACAPINLYGSLKLAQEHLLKTHANNRQFDYVIFRPICVFGNYDLADRLVPKFIKSAIANQDIFYSQDTTTDVTYVDDMVQALTLAIESDCKNETYNISSEHTLTIKQLADIIKEHYNSSSTLIPVNREKYFPNRGSLVVDKIKHHLGYKRRFDLHQALGQINADTIY